MMIFALGDMIGFDISHPCLTFDKWRTLPVLNAQYQVIDVVQTFFLGANRPRARQNTSLLCLEQLSLLAKDDLGAHGMNAHISVHKLSNVNVDGHTGEHIRVVAA